MMVSWACLILIRRAAQPSTALLLGATGASGRHVLRELLASKQFSSVVEAGRRVTPAEQLQDVPEAFKSKLVQKVIDFERIDDAGLKDVNADVVVITVSGGPSPFHVILTICTAGNDNCHGRVPREVQSH